MCGPLNPTRIILPFLCSPSYTHTHAHAHTHAHSQNPSPDRTLIIPETYVPSPLTWLSNYYIDSAATSTSTHSLSYFPMLKTSGGVLQPLLWICHRWWSDGYIPNHILKRLTKSSANCWLVWTTCRAGEYGRPVWLYHTSSLPLFLAALLIKVLALSLLR